MPAEVVVVNGKQMSKYFAVTLKFPAEHSILTHEIKTVHSRKVQVLFRFSERQVEGQV